MERTERRTRGRGEVGYGRLLAWSAVVGILGGLFAAAYYYVLHGGLWAVWDAAFPALGRVLPSPVATVALTTVGGVLVGLAVRRLGAPGEISAVVDNIHMEHGRVDPRATPAMVLISLVSICFGGSAGPEAPLVQVIGSGGSVLGDRLRLRGEQVRTLTFCGMAAALGAFFGAPLGGALFALEIPHRRGLEYYEALVPASVSALCAYVVFRGIVGFEGALYHFGAVPEVNALVMAEAVGFACLGAGAGVLFVRLFRLIGQVAHRLERHPVLLATLGGLAIGLLALATPGFVPASTLMWGEYEARNVLHTLDPGVAGRGALLVAGGLVILALAKMLAIGCTLHSGFRGGFIFPLFFIGAALGSAVVIATGGAVTPAVAVLCTMAAINVAVTKTPVSTTLILTTLSGTSMMPALAAASIVAFVLTTRISLIGTQRRRQFAPA